MPPWTNVCIPAAISYDHGHLADQLPGDACPFRRPFPDDFDDCPAYGPSQYTGLDLKYRPLPPVWTCSHLDIERRPGRERGYYGRCTLGSAENRLRWVEEVNAARLERLRSLNRELAAVLEGAAREFWGMKGRQLQALRGGEDPTESTRALEMAAGRLQEVADRFLEDRADELEAVHLPLDVTRDVIRAALDAMLTQETTETRFRITDEMLERFPAEVRALLRPRPAA